MSDESKEVSTFVQVDTNDALAGIGRSRRPWRRWPEALKRQIVAETREPGASVSVVARRHDVNANQVFKWRHDYAGEAVGDASLVPVTVVPAAPPDGGGLIEVEFSGGVRLRISGAVNGAVLRQLLEHLA